MNSARQNLIERVRQAAAQGELLRVRGGASKDFHGQTLQGEVLDTTGLHGVVSYEPSELVVTVQAGTPLRELEALLAGSGQYLPFEPPHFVGADGVDRATCGGMVAAGLSGPARASVGSVRDYVLGVGMINGRGEDLTFGGQVMKNVAGYDVSRLMAGSLGTLGVLTDISLKVLPLAPAQATLRFELGQAQSLEQLNLWGGKPLPLNASAWHQENGRGLLTLRLRGAVAAVDAACRLLGGERLPEPAAEHWWQGCREQTLAFFAAPPAPGDSLWRLSVPQTAPVLPLAPQTFVEWHGAQRWLWAPAASAVSIRQATIDAGGHATLFRPATAADRAVGVFQPLTGPQSRIQQALKRQFDPAGVFNRARLYPEF
jgi:glycolate oxidase FAD binding subunit